jgi:two-component system OmpR family sensor kinase
LAHTLNRLFVRFALLVTLAILVASLLVHFAISQLFGDPLEDIARRQASAQIFLLEQYVDKAPADEWLTRLNKVREVSQVRLELVPMAQARSAVAPRSVAALERGELVLDADQRAFLRRVDLDGERYVGSADDVVFAQDLPIDLSLALKMEALRYLIVAIVLLVPIALWTRGHWRDLQALSKVADRFGAGDLSARSDCPPHASIYPLSTRINNMAGRIETLVANQDHLLHSVSHELRTPIARLAFAIELLRGKADDPALGARFDGIETDLAELEALVEELLGMAKMGRDGTVPFVPLDLRSLLQERVEGLGFPVHLAKARTPVTVLGERRLLARALDNVLRNARKYATSCITISMNESQDRVDIVIDDDGPGIPESEREHVFEPFHRLDRSRDRATGGFGLGLAIARKALLLHGGSIRADDATLGGARFVISLPRRATGD